MGSAMALTFIEPRSAADRDAFAALNWAYRDYLLSFPEPALSIVKANYPEAKYRALLAADMTPPSGINRLGCLDGRPVACGTVQTLAPGDAEIKRVYVSPAARGFGVGRELMLRLIEDCRAMRFRRILMDTGAHMTDARKLHTSVGFRERGPYQNVPPETDGLLTFFEMQLAEPGST